MNKSEQESVIAVALLAAFADGQKDEAEHAAIRRVSVGFKLELVDMMGLYQQVLTGQLNLQQAVAGLTSDQSKTLAYEVGRCICEANGVMHPDEVKFLAELTAALRPAEKNPADKNPASSTASNVGYAAATQTTSEVASEVASNNDMTLIGPISDPKQPLDPILIKYSILTAALELLPQTAGIFAILPLQLKMVYDISKRHGIDIDEHSIKDFGAALGIGAASQMLEAGLRKLLSTVVGSVGGSTMGSMSSSVAGTAMTFATTYALGTVANQYYTAGRKLDLAALKTEFSSLVEKAKVTHAQYADEITAKATQLGDMLKNGNLASVLGGLVQGKF